MRPSKLSPTGGTSGTCERCSSTSATSRRATRASPASSAGSSRNSTRHRAHHPTTVQRFAQWHHLRSIRRRSSPVTDSQAATHSAKQEITVALEFLGWLTREHGRTLADCEQDDIDRWLAAGPSTRGRLRTFIVFALDKRLSPRRLSVPAARPAAPDV